ncbi:serine/threonine-protein phosphatase 7 long form [Capsicum galapagoense]
MAMIERWRPEMHTFHLPFGEVTLTLQDIQILFGLCVERNAATYRDLMHRSLDWSTLLLDLTGFTPAPGDFSGTSSLYIRALVKYIQQQVVQDPITNDTPDDRVQRIARIYMLLILGAILFPNTSWNHLSLRFLYFLVDLNETGTYSWGSAVLAYIYHCLCQISIEEKNLEDSFLSSRVDSLIPYGRKWTRGVKRDTETHHALVPVRDQVDHLTSEQV